MIQVRQTDTSGIIIQACAGRTVSGGAGRTMSVGGTAGTTPQSTGNQNSGTVFVKIGFLWVPAAGVTWAAGTWTIRLNISTGNANLNITECYVCRLNSADANQATIASDAGLSINCSAGVKTITLTGSSQSPSAGDKVYVAIVLSNQSGQMNQSLSFTPSELVDAPFSLPAPVLSNQSVGSLTSQGGVPQVDTDTGSGTLYMVVVPNNDSPSAAQIKAGQNSSGGAALWADNDPISATGTHSFAEVTGLSASTAYDCWFVHNANGADSTPVKADFTTQAAQVYKDATGAGRGHGLGVAILGRKLAGWLAAGRGHGLGAVAANVWRAVTGAGTGHGSGSADASVLRGAAGSGVGHGSGSAAAGAFRPLAGAGTGHGSGSASATAAPAGAYKDAEGSGVGHGFASAALSALRNVAGAGWGHVLGSALASTWRTAQAQGRGSGSGSANASAFRGAVGVGTGHGSGAATASAYRVGAGAGVGHGSGSCVAEAAPAGQWKNLTGAGRGHGLGSAAANAVRTVSGTGSGHGSGSAGAGAFRRVTASGVGRGSGSCIATAAPVGQSKTVTGAGTGHGSGSASANVQRAVAGGGSGHGLASVEVTVWRGVSGQSLGRGLGSARLVLPRDLIGGESRGHGLGSAASEAGLPWYYAITVATTTRRSVVASRIYTGAAVVGIRAPVLDEEGQPMAPPSRQVLLGNGLVSSRDLMAENATSGGLVPLTGATGSAWLSLTEDGPAIADTELPIAEYASRPGGYRVSWTASIIDAALADHDGEDIFIVWRVPSAGYTQSERRRIRAAVTL